jgi:2-polyprenyl-3-methyl-5-hydroxy-6-metoxy-1,4-benzoquinol methylase
MRAIAAQAFLTDYAAYETGEEAEDAERLLGTLNSVPADRLDARDLLVLACFRPLHLVDPLVQDAASLRDAHLLGGLLKLQVRDVLRERELMSQIPAFGSIADPVSRATRGQYEENPCPRWNAVHSLPQPAAMLDRTRGLEILNAGCGTGLETINAARVLKSSSFTGIDLSLASLAYGTRQAAEAGLSNVTFLHGDILEVSRLGRKFDVILSSGVLHHMADPQQGLNALAGVLKPGGSRMLIGLYSRIAREHLFADIHAYIRERGYGANAAHIRQFRKDVLASAPGHFLRNAQRFRDFKSLSECRDMLFHVQEHWLTLPDVARMLDEAGLRVVRFLAPPELVRLYLQQFPDDAAATDLARWHHIELHNPQAFRNMYYLWLAFKADRATADTSSAVWAVENSLL